jgi:hypothetical protein
MPYNPKTKKMMPNKTAGKKANSSTAGPNGSFPIGDLKHARLAEQMAPKSYNAGNISKGQEISIEKKAKLRIANLGKYAHEKRAAK